MFTAVLFTTAKKYKSNVYHLDPGYTKCGIFIQWNNIQPPKRLKSTYISNMTNLEDDMQIVGSQTQKAICCLILFTWNVQNSKSRLVVIRVWGGERVGDSVYDC
jgi:hypothetical protein